VKAIDTTGAGDSFVGALLTAVAKDTSIFEVSLSHTHYKMLSSHYHDIFFVLLDQNEQKLREALTFANGCGAICTTVKGAIPALPTAEEASKFISNSKAS